MECGMLNSPLTTPGADKGRALFLEGVPTFLIQETWEEDLISHPPARPWLC